MSDTHRNMVNTSPFFALANRLQIVLVQNVRSFLSKGEMPSCLIDETKRDLP